jgi:hypothetical protein
MSKQYGVISKPKDRRIQGKTTSGCFETGNTPTVSSWEASYLLNEEKSLLVALRKPSAKHFWDGLEQPDARLKESL